MTDFTLDPRLAATSEALADLPLCHVRLALDRRWPWLVLVPRRSGLRDLIDLAHEDREALWGELDRAAKGLRIVGETIGFATTKLNVAALGNVVPQLHVHVIGRNEGDAAWPGPIWGVGEPVTYAAEELARACAAARAALD